MKLLTVLFISLFPILVMSQKTKKIVVKLDSWPKKKEVYHVLASEMTMRHGSYKILGHKKTVLTSGYYSFGEKDSLWIEYNWRRTDGGRVIKCKGHFLKGEKVGIWNYYDHTGILVQEYDYTTNTLISSTEKNPHKESSIILDNDTINVTLDTPVYFKGSSAMIQEYINKNLNYPQSALENGVSGDVIVTFNVDINGNASDHVVINQIGSGLDEAALFAVKKIPNDWISGTYNGKPVKVIMTMPIRFVLD